MQKEQIDKEQTLTTHEPVSMENIPLAVGCLLDDLAEIKSIVMGISQHIGIGATGTKPVTICDAAQFLSLSERQIKKMIKERSIPYYERNGKIYFFEKELLEWVKANRVSTLDEELRKRNSRYNRR